ncbi:MAG: hypothetical protein HZC29_03805 [Thaumarchaeota archaeon]|nr:hypothetical protein [Nitrososphaerota archaeon]
MTIDIPIRNADDMTTVYATNTVPFDAPIYDDLDGVIDDYDNPYDQTKPIEVFIPVEVKPKQKDNKLAKLDMDFLFSFFYDPDLKKQKPETNTRNKEHSLP